MTCLRVQFGDTVGIVTLGGPIRTLKDLNGRVWRFEMHRIFGPFVVDRRGNEVKRQPMQRSPFWKPFQWWHEQGQRVTDTGECVYDVIPEPKLLCIGGRNYVEDTPRNRERFADYIVGD